MGWESNGTTNKDEVLWSFDVSSVRRKFWSMETKSKCGKLRIGTPGRLEAGHVDVSEQHKKELIILVKDEELG